MCEITSSTNKQSIALTSVNITLGFLQKYTQRAGGVEPKSTLRGGKENIIRKAPAQLWVSHLNAALSQGRVGKYLRTSSLEGKKASAVAMTKFHRVNAANESQCRDTNMASTGRQNSWEFNSSRIHSHSLSLSLPTPSPLSPSLPPPPSKGAVSSTPLC